MTRDFAFRKGLVRGAAHPVEGGHGRPATALGRGGWSARRGVKKAIVAIAADLLRAAYFILTRHPPYHDLGAAFFYRLDTTKATANLVRRPRALGYDVHVTPAA